jgi:DNA-binding MarR family transcriptional regulator
MMASERQQQLRPRKTRGESSRTAIEQAAMLAAERVSARCRAHHDWADRVRAGLLALLEFFDERPDLAHLLVVRAPLAGPRVLAHRRELLERLAGAIDEGRERAGRQPAPLTAEGLVGGALSVIHSRLVDPDGRSLVELLNPLMSFIVMPYLGRGVARMELHRPLATPVAPSARRGQPYAPNALDFRMTYRTMRVLSAIGARPGISSSEVGVLAGIADQGQISKLLARLVRLELIETSTAEHSKRGANAWRLTSKGSEVELTVRRETERAASS